MQAVPSYTNILRRWASANLSNNVVVVSIRITIYEIIKLQCILVE